MVVEARHVLHVVAGQGNQVGRAGRFMDCGSGRSSISRAGFDLTSQAISGHLCCRLAARSGFGRQFGKLERQQD